MAGLRHANEHSIPAKDSSVGRGLRGVRKEGFASSDLGVSAHAVALGFAIQRQGSRWRESGNLGYLAFEGNRS